MPDGASPEPEEGAEVAEAPDSGPSSAVDFVFHPNPVSIPAGALRAPPVRRPSFGPTFMIGACAALWISAALATGETVPILFVAGWLIMLALDLRIALRKS